MKLNHLFVFGAIVTTVGFGLSTLAQACVGGVPLSVVGGQETELTKRVESRGNPLVPGSVERHDRNSSNWFVPQDQKFKKFIITLTPQSSSYFNIEVNFIYSDHDGTRRSREQPLLAAGQPFAIAVDIVDNKQPVTLHLYVGGEEAVGTEYKVSAKGCF